MKDNKSPGVDGIPRKLLKIIVEQISTNTVRRVGGKTRLKRNLIENVNDFFPGGGVTPYIEVYMYVPCKYPCF